ncbi:glycosyltransferase family 39 protein [bacterium]|nr:glycosyltransferase family 39 protein [candidate division CSSED10-310 bacterium]
MIRNKIVRASVIIPVELIAFSVFLALATGLISQSDRQFAAGEPVWGILRPVMELLRTTGLLMCHIQKDFYAVLIAGLSLSVFLAAIATFRWSRWSGLFLAAALSIYCAARLSLIGNTSVAAIHWLLLGISFSVAVISAACRKRSDLSAPQQGTDECEDRVSIGTSMNLMYFVNLLIILSIAFAFRMYRIDILPPGEAQHTAEWGMLGAVQAAEHSPGIRDTQDRSFFLEQLRLRLIVEPHQQGLNILADWLLAGWFRPSIVVQRSATAVMGLVSVLVSYWVGWLLFGPFVANATAFLMAVSPWHVTHSRYSSIEHIIAILLVTLTMVFLLRFLKNRSIWTLAGLILLLAADFHVYVTAQFIVPVVILVWLLSIIKCRKKRWMSFVVMLVSLLIVSVVIAPKTGLYGLKDNVKLLNTQIEEHPDYAIQNDWVVMQNAVKLARGLFLDGPGDAWYDKRGYLVWPVSMLLVIGLGYALTFIGKFRYQAVLIWFCIGLIPTLPSAVVAPRRILCAMPAIYCLAGIGAEYIGVTLLAKITKGRILKWIIIPVLALAIASGAWVVIEDNVVVAEVLCNGQERRLAEIACTYVNNYRVIMLFEPHTRREKIWMACGDAGLEAMKRIEFYPSLEAFESALSQPVSSDLERIPSSSVVIIFPESDSVQTKITILQTLFPGGALREYRFDPHFKDHAQGQPCCRAWVVPASVTSGIEPGLQN